MKHKIIIFEGQDRLGKSTCIKTLIDDLEIQGYQVVTMYGDHTTGVQKLGPDRIQHFGDLYKNNKNAFNFGSASFETLAFSLRNMFSIAERPTVMIFDRLTLSNIAYGMTIRPDSFLKLHGTVRNYIAYTNDFEKYLNKLADTYLINIVTDHIFDIDPDDSNPFITVTAGNINKTRPWFAIGYETSKISNKKQMTVTIDHTGYFNTLELFNEDKEEFFELTK